MTYKNDTIDTYFSITKFRDAGKVLKLRHLLSSNCGPTSVVIVVSYRDAFVDDFEGMKFTRISVNLVVTLFDDKVLIKIQGKSCQSKHA